MSLKQLSQLDLSIISSSPTVRFAHCWLFSSRRHRVYRWYSKPLQPSLVPWSNINQHTPSHLNIHFIPLYNLLSSNNSNCTGTLRCSQVLSLRRKVDIHTNGVPNPARTLPPSSKVTEQTKKTRHWRSIVSLPSTWHSNLGDFRGYGNVLMCRFLGSAPPSVR